MPSGEVKCGEVRCGGERGRGKMWKREKKIRKKISDRLNKKE